MPLQSSLDQVGQSEREGESQHRHREGLSLTLGVDIGCDLSHNYVFNYGEC